MFSFVNCILFHDEQNRLPFFVIRLFFCYNFCFTSLFFPTCKLYIVRYREDEILFSLPEVEVLDRTFYFPDLKGQNEIDSSDEYRCLCDGNVTCCFKSCTLIFYQTLGLSVYADHQCCCFHFYARFF